MARYVIWNVHLVGDDDSWLSKLDNVLPTGPLALAWLYDRPRQPLKVQFMTNLAAHKPSVSLVNFGHIFFRHPGQPYRTASLQRISSSGAVSVVSQGPLAFHFLPVYRCGYIILNDLNL